MNPATRAAAAIGAALLLLPASSASALPARATVLHASLAPSGDANGSGSATVRLRPAPGRVCASISWSAIEDPFAAHIHRRSDGQVVVDLTGSVTEGARCVDAPRALIRAIAAHPRRYYVNVHNRTYPAGAIQGPLTLHG
jgi:CHRD domain